MNTQTETTPFTYTLNCRRIARTPGITSPEELAVVQPLLEHGGPIPMHDPYWVELDHHSGWSCFCLNQGRKRLTMNMIVWDETQASQLWSRMEAVLYLSPRDQFDPDRYESARPVPPAVTPWRATLTYPILMHPDWSVSELSWIEAFQRIYAEALLAKVTA